MKLVIGNKNYSSWSMRPWVLLRELDIPFEEQVVRMDSFDAGSMFKTMIGAMSPVGKVPLLVLDDGVVVWDTLAIAETLAERFPDRALWPRDATQRARARSICAEMHAGFPTVRDSFGMNIEARLPDVGRRVLERNDLARRELARLDAIWSEAIAAHGGPFLFGDYGIADAFFAPVATRVRTYDLPLSPGARRWCDAMLASRGVQAWTDDALREKDFLEFEEPYRPAPA